MAGFAPFVDIAAEMGARHVLATGDDPDAPRLVARFAELCARAARFELTVDLEFVPWMTTADIVVAARIVRAVRHTNFGIAIDALHFDRSGRRARCLPPRMADHQRLAAARTAVPGKRPRPCRRALAHRRPRLPSLRGHPDLAGPADSGVRPVPITVLRTPAAAGAGGSHGTGWGHDGEPRHGALPAAAAGAQPALPHRADALGDLARARRRGRR